MAEWPKKTTGKKLFSGEEVSLTAFVPSRGKVEEGKGASFLFQKIQFGPQTSNILNKNRKWKHTKVFTENRHIRMTPNSVTLSQFHFEKQRGESYAEIWNV